MNAVRKDLLNEGKAVAVTRLCCWLGVPRSSAYYQPRQEAEHRPCDEDLSEMIRAIIEERPTYGVRRAWAWLRYRMGVKVNRKKVHRLMRLKGWTLRTRRTGRRPRVEAFPSVAAEPNQRWSTDIALVDCGVDGWCVFVPVLDCCTRECLGWALERTARTRTAERALEEALLARFGWVRGAPAGMALRHDNGLVFGSRRYRALVRDDGLQQEYTAPYTPEQNGLCERFIRSFKEECAWLHRFSSIEDARTKVAAFVHDDNYCRPHQALGYKTPAQCYQLRCLTLAA